MSIGYQIRNEETGEFLAALYLGCRNAVQPLIWKNNPNYAIEFESKEEAQATIQFIGAVIDWELEEQLLIIEVLKVG